MSKRERKKRNRQRSRLDQHKRDKTVLTPPLLTLPQLMLVEWLPTQFPDMLWACLHTTANGREGLHLATRAIERMQEAASHGETRPVIDGRLTGFENLGADERELVLRDLLDGETYEDVFPEPFAHLLGMYPEAPGSWLIQPWRDRGVTIDPDVAQSVLNDVVVECRTGYTDASTWAKAVVFGGLLSAGKLHFGADVETVELLPRYPMLSDDDNARVESFIRASFGVIANMGAEDNGEPVHQAWARRFWNANWRIYPCRFAELERGAGEDDDAAIRDAADEFAQSVEATYGRVVETARTTDPGLYSPDRHEVLSGLAARACRIASAVAGSPVMWSGEQIAAPARTLLESHITMKWLVQHSDPAIFVKFKEYGRGKLKLTKLHYQEHLDSMDDPPEGLAEFVEALEQRVNEDVGEEFQTINVGKAFGKDLRRMAQEVGMEQQYRLLYQPHSDISHGVWTSLDAYSLTRCANPAHRWHRLPGPNLDAWIGTQALSPIASLLDDIVETYAEAMSQPPD